MIDIDILFYDSIICSNIGFYFFIIGLIQICREPENYGIIGYIYHRIYTTIGFVQMFHITRIIDNSIINRIFNQLIFLSFIVGCCSCTFWMIEVHDVL